MKRVLVILEGASDLPIKVLRNRTPLEIARMPVMERLATIGRQGMVDPTAFTEGYGPEQYLWSLLGMGPEPWPHGTGLLEAIGHGMEINPEYWYLSAGLVTMIDQVLDDPGVDGLSDEEAQSLFAGIDQLGLGLEHFFLEDGRAVLRVSRELWPGAAVSALRNPPQLLSGKAASSFLPGGPDGAIVREAWFRCCERLWEEDVNLVRADLGEATANGIWWWGGPLDGRNPAPEIGSFSSRIKGGVVTDSDAFCGLARVCGLEPRRVDPYKGQKSYYSDRLAEVAELLGNHDVIIVHSGRPLECSLKGALDEKVWALEGLDQLLLRPLLEMLKGVDGWRLIVTAGAGASVEQRCFIKEPVPFLVAGSGVRADAYSGWNERTAATGVRGLASGADIWRLLVRP